MPHTEEQRQHMHDVADAFEAESERFNMNHFEKHAPDCGTIMCIAGWSRHIRGKDVLSIPDYGYDWEEPRMDEDDVRYAMGLTRDEFSRLCLGDGMDVALKLPEHLRAKGMADAVRQIANGATVTDALNDVAERYV